MDLVFREVPLDLWDDTLRDAHAFDPYLRLGYFLMAASSDGGTPVMLHTSAPTGDVILCVLLRQIPGSPYLDAASPYGYGGPVALGHLPPLSEFDRSFRKWCADRAVVSVFLRSHPSFGNQRFPLSNVAFRRELAGTVVWHIDEPDLVAGMRQTHRNAVRRGLKDGIRTEVNDGVEGLDVFRPMYETTMERLGASEAYRFGDAYWRALSAHLHDQLVIGTASLDGTPQAAALCFRSGEWVHYHLSATSDEGRRNASSRLVLLAVAEAARQSGARFFHLGGGYGGKSDSLLQFKQGFAPSSDPMPVTVTGLVQNAEAYADLVGISAAVDGEFFPAYRSNLPHDPGPGS